MNNPNENIGLRQKTFIILIFVTAVTAGLFFLLNTIYRDNGDIKITDNNQENLEINQDLEINPETISETSQNNQIIEPENNQPAITDKVDDSNFDQEVDTILEDIENIDIEMGDTQDLSDKNLGL